MMSEEQALKLLLAGWRAPAAPDALRLRVVNSYRRQLSRRAVAAEEGEEMKRCPMCREEFAVKFRFCPVDGLPLVAGTPDALAVVFAETQLEQTSEQAHALNSLRSDVFDLADEHDGSLPPTPTIIAAPAQVRAEYHLTILAEAGLCARLTTEVRAVAAESQLTWPELKRDPASFARRTIAGYSLALRRLFAQENVAYGLVTAFVLVLTLVGAVVALEQYHKTHPTAVARTDEEYDLIGMINSVPNEPKHEEGPAGMAARGTGGGSLQNKERPGGGGSGGRHETLPASQGILPPGSLQPPILAPDPKPPVIQNPNLPVQTTLQADPVLFPPDPRAMPYGDPKSQAKELSSGPGDGNGIGDSHGAGVGTGNGNGYGSGEDWNTGGGSPKLGSNGPGCCGGTTTDYSKTFSIKDVTKRAVITAKPTPDFTEEARKNGVTGEVLLRLVLTSSGTVTGIQPVKRLPDGLTEKAIEAAKRIQFIPAEKDGHRVSQYVVISYNFNIY
ncbi:MAG: TonB family protein [Pyrinomonadaceae bacterium]